MVTSRILVTPTGEYLNTNKVTTSEGEVHNEVIDQGNIISPSVADAGSVEGNSRAASTLAAAGTFQGVGEDVSRYGRVGVAIKSDNATDGTLTMQVSHDNVNWGGPTRAWSDTRFGAPHMWNIVEKYFRILYTNGSTEATNLAIQVQYSNNANILLGHQLNETLLDETEAIIARSVAVGQNPNDTYVNEGVSGVDDANSSSTNLTAATSLVFTGAWHDISTYSGITCLVDGTASTTTTGTLEMQFSHDTVTVHRNISVATADVADTLPRTLGVVAQYFRVIYTSDGDLLTFVIQTMLHTEQVAIVSRMSQTIQGTEDVALVRDPTWFDLDVARIHITGQKSFFFFGQNNALGNGSWSDVTTAEADFHWPEAAAKVKFKSTHAADTAAGLGLRSIELHGLDINGNAIEEILSLSGVTPVESANSYYRLMLVHNETVGTYGGSHQGDIEFRVTNATFGSGALMGIMQGLEGAADSGVQYGFGEAQMGFTSIPLGKVAYLTRLEVIPNSAKPIDVVLYEREDILDVTTPFSPRRVLWSADELSNPVEKEFKSHLKIKALADVYFRAQGNGAASGVAVSLDYYLVDADANGR